LFDKALALNPQSRQVLREKAKAVTGLEQLALKRGDFTQGLALNKKSLTILEAILNSQPSDNMVRAAVATRQSDLLWQYHLLLSNSERRRLILRPLQELENLIIHDPKNERWRKDFIWHLYYALKFCDSQDLERKIFTAFNQFIAGQDLVALSAGQDFILKSISMRQHWHLGEKSSAKRLLREMDASFNEGAKLSRRYAFVLADMHFDIGDTEKAIKYADIYLADAIDNETTKRLDVIARQSQSQFIAGRCETAKDTLSLVIEIVEEPVEDIKRIINCKT